MYGFLIVGIVFSFLTVSSFLEYSSKKDRQKIEAALRMEEMRRGYEPGTYSSKFNKKNKNKKNNFKDVKDEIKSEFTKEYAKKYTSGFNKDFVDEELDSREQERADLKKGIDDLMTRINNLETIMKADEKDE